jgi:hypothetical protein
MLRIVRRIAAVALLTAAATLPAAPAAAGQFYKYYEYDEDPSGVIGDTLIMRPAGLVGFFTGLGLFFPAAVISTVVGQPQAIPKVFDSFVIQPGEWVFVDEIGTH